MSDKFAWHSKILTNRFRFITLFVDLTKIFGESTKARTTERVKALKLRLYIRTNDPFYIFESCFFINFCIYSSIHAEVTSTKKANPPSALSRSNVSTPRSNSPARPRVSSPPYSAVTPPRTLQSQGNSKTTTPIGSLTQMRSKSPENVSTSSTPAQPTANCMTAKEKGNRKQMRR